MGRLAFAVFAALAVACAAGVSAESADADAGVDVDLSATGASESALLVWVNKARTTPAAVVAELQKMVPKFQGTLYVDGNFRLQTKEGVKAVNEAIKTMKAHKPIGALAMSAGMSKAAASHVADMGPKGKFQHNGSDGSTPFTRMNRYGKWGGTAGENMGAGYGPGKELQMLLQLIVDDGVADRGHRKNLLNAKFKKIGLAVGAHKVYGHMDVMDFAETYTEKPKKF